MAFGWGVGVGHKGNVPQDHTEMYTCGAFQQHRFTEEATQIHRDRETQSHRGRGAIEQ